MSRFAHIAIQDGSGVVRVVEGGGAFLARALLASRAREGETAAWRAAASGMAAGSLRGEPLASAIACLAAYGGPDVPRELLASAAASDAWDVKPFVPGDDAALAAWPRSVAPAPTIDAIGFPHPRDVAIHLLEQEGRGHWFGGIPLETYSTATYVLGELARVAGVAVTDVAESWDPTCTRERWSAGEPVGGGDLHFAIEGAPHRVYLSFDTWFSFDTVESMAACFPTRDGRRLRPVPDRAAVAFVDDDEAARLIVDWGVVFAGGATR